MNFFGYFNSPKGKEDTWVWTRSRGRHIIGVNELVYSTNVLGDHYNLDKAEICHILSMGPNLSTAKRFKEIINVRGVKDAKSRYDLIATITDIDHAPYEEFKKMKNKILRNRNIKRLEEQVVLYKLKYA